MHSRDSEMFLVFPRGSARASECAQLIERLTLVSKDTRLGIFKGMLPFLLNRRMFQ